MKNELAIASVVGREILDSRGNPTVEAEVVLCCGARAKAGVPSGASTGAFEAVEKRDGQMERYAGLGVLQAASHVSGTLCETVFGMDASDTRAIDAALLCADATQNLSRFGANAVLSVSLACARAASAALHLPLYRFLGGAYANVLPMPMMNVLNGGAHASNTLDVQEFMIVPVGLPNFREALAACAQVYHTLARLLKERGHNTAVGDEGGFAPNLQSDEEALCFLMEAIERAGYRAGEDFTLAIDAAASEWKTDETGIYRMKKSEKTFDSAQLAAHWEGLYGKFPLWSLEDPLDEEDWDGWQMLTQRMGDRVQLVGDDLFVTNDERLKRGIEKGCANSILIKPNQIGTLTRTMDAVRTAHAAGYAAIVSHRSGETVDTSIADIAVALSTGRIKTGAPCRGERIAKYNRLLRIEQELGTNAVYAGMSAMHTMKKA